MNSDSGSRRTGRTNMNKTFILGCVLCASGWILIGIAISGAFESWMWFLVIAWFVAFVYFCNSENWTGGANSLP